jgi:predicted component of type VI protein secretion system
MPPINHKSPGPTFEAQVLALLREIADKLDGLRAAVASQDRQRRRREAADLETLSAEELQLRLGRARQENEAYDVLDIRRVLVERLSDDERSELDRGLARWFTAHFHEALRAGRAAEVAGALERAVQDIGDIPEMTLLAESLPTVLRSVGLYLDAREDDAPDESD